MNKRYPDEFFSDIEFNFVKEPEHAHSNYWLNTVVCPNLESRNELLEFTNQGVMARPVWQLMHRLPMFTDVLCGNLTNSEWAEARLVNLPSAPV